MTKPKSKAILVAVLLVVFLPIPSEISKATKIRFALTDGRLVPSLKVYQDWECFGIAGRGYDERTTDAEGMVRFPSRYGYGSILMRALGRLFQLIAVHASYGANINIEFTLPNPMQAVFSPPAFKPLEPFATSGSYLDSIGRDYFPQEDKEGERDRISCQPINENSAIQITVDPKHEPNR
jgi:hypothetical protein